MGAIDIAPPPCARLATPPVLGNAGNHPRARVGAAPGAGRAVRIARPGGCLFYVVETISYLCLPGRHGAGKSSLDYFDQNGHIDPMPKYFNASEAKYRFGELLDEVLASGSAYILKHGRLVAVIQRASDVANPAWKPAGFSPAVASSHRRSLEPEEIAAGEVHSPRPSVARASRIVSKPRRA
jgi:antitoxin (DNA-binding transcriptional repressor) of toxin-antitoxin stability system